MAPSRVGARWVPDTARRNGKLVESWLFSEDLYAADEFFS
jgi:hypothetical protein